VVVESPETYQQWLAAAATQVPTAAYNPAFDEYNRASQQAISAGWKTVVPAPPPIVNYSSAKDSSS